MTRNNGRLPGSEYDGSPSPEAGSEEGGKGAGHPEMILQALEDARRHLLDLSMKNTLLNHKITRRSTIEVVGADLDHVYGRLVAEGKSFSFKSSQEPEVEGQDLASNGSQPEQDFSTPPQSRTPNHRPDSTLKTRLTEEDLLANLLRISTVARASIEEQGVNTLFLALGALQWYEAANSEQVRIAPLILVPCYVERKGLERFKIRYSGEEIATNLSLQRKLNEEFRLELPELGDSDEVIPTQYLSQVAEAVSQQDRWLVDAERISLGFFSHAKYLMFKDLDPKNWPGEAGPLFHPIASALLGSGFQVDVDSEDPPLVDRVRPARDAHEILEADSSQALAMMDALRRGVLVIEGPPGTGKSQTICNLISEFVHAGKKVLFVSEKMAALEVVKRNLTNVGLGQLCLELHSRKANKKAVLEELRQTVGQGRPKGSVSADLIPELESLISRLNEICFALHEPVQPSGLSPRRAVEKLLGIPSLDSLQPVGTYDEAGEWDAEELRLRLQMAEEVQEHLAAHGPPRHNPFYGAVAPRLAPTNLRDFVAQWQTCLRSSQRVRLLDIPARRALRLDRNRTEQRVSAIARLLSFISELPDEALGASLEAPVWESDGQLMLRIAHEGKRLAELHAQYEAFSDMRAWEEDPEPLLRELQRAAEKRLRVLSLAYWRARRWLRRRVRGVGKGFADTVQVLEDLAEARRLRTDLAARRQVCEEAFGSCWQGEVTNWRLLARLAEWMIHFYQLSTEGELPKHLVDGLSWERLRLIRDLDVQLREALGVHVCEWDSCMTELSPRDGSRPAMLSPDAYEEQSELLESWIRDPALLQESTAYERLRTKVIDAGCDELVDLAEEWTEARSRLRAAALATHCRGVIEKAWRSREVLRDFDEARHAHMIDKFCQVDQELLKLNRARLKLLHSKMIAEAQRLEEFSYLSHELHKTRRHLPIRRLMEVCGAAVQGLKPVFMMSPLSVAAFLTPLRPSFDVLIVDEASQVKPEDSLGAILRCGGAVVAGDSQQLPPTAFFERLTAGDEVDDGGDDYLLRPSDIESILGLFKARGAKHRRLCWHYRSRHHSLIDVSNREFYQSGLEVFPSPLPVSEALGLTLRYLPGTAYDRGGTRTNPDEANEVVAAILKHAREHPELTLGVVALSQSQQEAIQRRLEKQRLRCPEYVAFEADHPEEPFFVKNLENVQGDERDVIFISIGYGKTAEGYFNHNLGPINHDGGERRLNVLITRARSQCVVFTNLRSGDIDLSRTSSRGVSVLKAFLNYAESGVIETSRPSGLGPESEFEADVLHELGNAGLNVHCQVGSAGFRVDLAVIHPRKPGEYVLGIECDGAKYHSARSARDRDRLRQKVLEDKGWRIFRIWSTDWLFHKAEIVQRIVARVQQLVADGHPPRSEISRSATAAVEVVARVFPLTDSAAPTEPATQARTRKVSDTRAPERTPRSRRPPEAAKKMGVDAGDTVNEPSRELPVCRAYEEARLDALKTLPFSRAVASYRLLQLAVRHVVETESPVHVHEVRRRIQEASAGGPVDESNLSKVDATVASLERTQAVTRRGEFIWKPDMARPPIRSRASFSSEYKRLDLVAPEEIDEAISAICQVRRPVEVQALAEEALALLGFSTVTTELRSTMYTAIRKLVSCGRLSEQEGGVSEA